MSGPVTEPPPSGPGRDEEPFDPESPEGRAVAERLTRILDQIEQDITEREMADRERPARAA